MDENKCPGCGAPGDNLHDFRNNDNYITEEVQRIELKRAELGLPGLTGNLRAVVINTEPDNLVNATNELLRYSGLQYVTAFKDDRYNTVVLKNLIGPDVLLRSRLNGKNPFAQFNTEVKAKHIPNTRLETYIFETPDIISYFDIQKGRGVNFEDDKVRRYSNYSFAQTIPSGLTGLSYGFIQWDNAPSDYIHGKAELLDLPISKPKKEYLGNISILDHTATRVEAYERDAAIIEFMELTDYDFAFAVYVHDQNSITNVARLGPDDFAMVFTSGISHSDDFDISGPTEKFVHQYGRRVHHLAFVAENIEETFRNLKDDGLEFLLELTGSPDEGLKQTFSKPSPYTLLVNEYIYRYGGFDGFFTKSNVTVLTEATNKQ
ncbi:MAG: hypothetical protein GY771_10935 [bacterium]|nr:hypothetical protein [bacterium]